MNERIKRKNYSMKSSQSQLSLNKLCDIRIVMLGVSGSGKTSITSQYLHGTFSKEYTPSITSHLFKPNVIIKQKRYSMEIVDTQGQDDQHDILLDQNIYQGDAFGVVYGGQEDEDLEQVRMFLDRIQLIKKDWISQSTPIVVVNNNQTNQKADLADIKELCKHYGASCKVTEQNLKNQRNIQSIFEPLLQQHNQNNQIRHSKDQLDTKHYSFNQCCHLF